MQNFPFFRRKLAHRLRACAARRRVTCATDPTGEDLRAIALFDRLAGDAERLPQALIDEVARRCADQRFARRFDGVWDGLFEVLGTLVVPTGAADLVRWMIHRAQHDPGDPGAPQTVVEPAPPACGVDAEPSRASPPRGDTLGSLLGDLTGAVAVAGPLLAIQEGATAVAQRREQTFAASHLSTTATVVAATAGDTGRVKAPAATEDLVFTPVGERLPCRVPVQLGFRRPDAVGQTLTVVPRSGACEPPVVPGAVGDPVTSGLVALAFLAGGVASLKACSWLSRRRNRPVGDARPRPVTLRVAR